MNKRKFRRGKQLTTLTDVIEAINKGEWIYWKDTPKHPRILGNMSLVTLLRAVENRILFEAERTQDEQS